MLRQKALRVRWKSGAYNALVNDREAGEDTFRIPPMRRFSKRGSRERPGHIRDG
jgi:hypothetical protein